MTMNDVNGEKKTDLIKSKCLKTPLLMICARVWLGCRDYELTFGYLVCLDEERRVCLDGKHQE